MNTTNNRFDDLDGDDLTLSTLLSVASEIGQDVPPSLLERLYALQKRHQFDADRSASLQEMQRLLESHLDQVQTGGVI